MHRRERKITHFFGGIGVALDQLTLLTSRRSTLGKIALFRHPELGKVFVLNGEIQHVEAWSPLYHEPLVHLPASFVSEVKDVLILGGGTLFAASEVLKYKSVERVVLLDHDPRVSETVAQHYSHAQACLNDHRFSLLHEDAYIALGRYRNQFDLVINDGIDLLATRTQERKRRPKFSVFSAMATALKPNGVCADVVFRHIFEQHRTLCTLRHLKQHARVAISLVLLPEYHGVLHVLSVWGRNSSSVSQTQIQPKNREQLSWRRNPKSSPCVYYDPRFLSYYLYLPRYLRTALAVRKTNV